MLLNGPTRESFGSPEVERGATSFLVPIWGRYYQPAVTFWPDSAVFQLDPQDFRLDRFVAWRNRTLARCSQLEYNCSHLEYKG